MYLATVKEFRGLCDLRVTSGALRCLGAWSPREEGAGAGSDRRPPPPTHPPRMELQDFLCHFDTVQICSLSPEVLGPSPAGGGWHIHTFQGRWVRGFSSGGSQPGAGESQRAPWSQVGGSGGGRLWLPG